MAGSIIIVMGVSGSGKTSVGEAIAQAWQRVFVDADDLHPQANISKMSRGIPLTDDDRMGWLNTIVLEAGIMVERGQSGVIACSALKHEYRNLLRSGIQSLGFLYLKASYEKVLRQLEARQGHFMPATLLQSQFDLLEEPGKEEKDVITVEVEGSLEATVEAALSKLANQYPYNQNAL